MNIIIFIVALWVWFVLVMQDGSPGSMRIVLILPIALSLGVTLLLIEWAAKKLREAVQSASAFIISFGRGD